VTDTSAVYISAEQHELAKIVAEYGPKWGFPVRPGIDAMAKAKPAPARTVERFIDDDTELGQQVKELAIEAEGLPEEERTVVVEMLTALQASVARRRNSPYFTLRSHEKDVLLRLTQGVSPNAIARELSLSEDALRDIIARIIKKTATGELFSAAEPTPPTISQSR